MGVSGQRHAPAALYPWRKDPQYPFYRRLGRPQSRSGHRSCRKNALPLPGIEPRSPGRPARSQTLYCLSYSGSLHQLVRKLFWGHTKIYRYDKYTNSSKCCFLKLTVGSRFWCVSCSVGAFSIHAGHLCVVDASCHVTVPMWWTRIPRPLNVHEDIMKPTELKKEILL
jgi:hypothetical protein